MSCMMMTPPKSIARFLVYEVTLIFLAMVSIGFLVFELTSVVQRQHQSLINAIDLSIACIFLVDFMVGLYRAPSRWHYFKHHWYELLAAIPLTDHVVRSLRSLRIVRMLRLIQILRIVRVFSRLKVVSGALDALGFQLFSLILVLFTLVFSSSVFFFIAERGINPAVTHLFDAFWWAMVTVTTIGYGDIYPMTTEGRLVAIFLMLSGLGVLGALTAMVSSHVFHLQQSKLTDPEQR
jgi:voltage-gated potassium channel